MAEKKRKVDPLALVSRDLERASGGGTSAAPRSVPLPVAAPEPLERPDPWFGQRKAYGVSMRTGTYASLKHLSSETGIPLARLVEQGVLHILEKYGYIQS